MNAGVFLLTSNLSLEGVGTSPFYYKPSNMPKWLDARFYTAAGGVSTGAYAISERAPGLNCAMAGPDSPIARKRNREIVAASFGVEASKLLTSRQSNSDVVILSNENSHIDWNSCERPRGNALLAVGGCSYVMGVVTADCPPVIIADTENPIAGIVHALRKELFGGLMEKHLAPWKYSVLDEKMSPSPLGRISGTATPTLSNRIICGAAFIVTPM